VNHALYANLLRQIPASDSAKLSRLLEQAETDAARLVALREYAGQLGAIIGTSRYRCDNWWADAVAPGYGTIVHADSELKAAIAAVTELALHRQLQTIVGEHQVGERGAA
jgi:hypothetical protein